MRRFSRKRIAFFSITLVIMMIIVVEGCAFLLYAILNRQLFPYRSFDEAIHRLASIPEIREEGIPSHKGELSWDDSAVEVIHPYLGFVRDPERSRDTSYLGFPQEKDDPFLRGSSDTLSVAVFGGSFAAGTSIAGESILQSTLGGYGRSGGRSSPPGSNSPSSRATSC